MSIKRIADFLTISPSPDVSSTFIASDNLVSGTRKIKLDDFFSIYNRAKWEALYPSFLLNPNLLATLQQLDDAIALEVTNRDAAILVETNARISADNQIRTDYGNSEKIVNKGIPLGYVPLNNEGQIDATFLQYVFVTDIVGGPIV